ncbi:Conjugative transposon protein TcpC [Mycobacteroides abscessus subsp. abscessus]|nr:Conjugative transposon protein TcpC [Mycobacteroides abscessus subsp. abscessus]
MKMPEPVTDLWARGEGQRGIWAALAGIGLLVTVALFGGFVFAVGALNRWLSDPPPPPPDPMTKYEAHNADAGMVDLLINKCAERWLTATKETLPLLGECVTIDPSVQDTPRDVAVATGLVVYYPQMVGQTDDLSEWRVIFGANVRDFSEPNFHYEYFEVPVALDKNGGGARAMLLPHTRMGSLPPGPDIQLDYSRTVDSGPVYDKVKGFLGAFLTRKDGNVSEYTTPDAGLVGVGAIYQQVFIKSMTANVTPAKDPSPGQQVHVLANVTVQSFGGELRSQQFPLLVVESGGRWAVADIEQIPYNNGEMLTPPGGR